VVGRKDGAARTHRIDFACRSLAASHMKDSLRLGRDSLGPFLGLPINLIPFCEPQFAVGQCRVELLTFCYAVTAAVTLTTLRRWRLAALHDNNSSGNLLQHSAE
jgi:hypothetical protein